MHKSLKANYGDSIGTKKTTRLIKAYRLKDIQTNTNKSHWVTTNMN
jgi:hypothetical protein